ncbi:MAG: hypothetical protein MUE46_15400 [Xanthomonadales bacterium]|jgi:hypothetical protein|nr:hypothetical protein [Xanthomonadales bacterium]
MLRTIPILLILLATPALASEAKAPAEPAATTPVDAKAKADRRKTAECGQTGTRIQGGNRTQSLRCYGRKDLERTGATDLGDALRRMDPSFR